MKTSEDAINDVKTSKRNFLYSVTQICILLIGIAFLLLYTFDRFHEIMDKYYDQYDSKCVEWSYRCDATFNQQFYNCPSNETFYNLTGQYCNGVQLCENGYKIVC